MRNYRPMRCRSHSFLRRSSSMSLATGPLRVAPTSLRAVRGYEANVVEANTMLEITAAKNRTRFMRQDPGEGGVTRGTEG